MNRIVTRIFGGLGNQLFIYATAKAISMRTGAKLVLDTRTGFLNDAYERRFALHHFDVQYEEADRLEQFNFPFGRVVRALMRSANQYLPFHNRFYLTDLLAQEWFFIEDITTFNPGYKTTWLEGYWQSPRYFDEIRNILTKELTVTSPLSAETLQMSEQIRSANSVCVHLRLSRNIIGGEVKTAVRQLDWQYYTRSIEFVAQQLENARFFCFSDNPQAAGLIQTLPYNITLVGHNKGDDRAHEDFYLMSLCRHFILSNSTFGWWPAWLCPHPGSIVISPPLHFWDNQDILPTHWTIFDAIQTNYSDAL